MQRPERLLQHDRAVERRQMSLQSWLLQPISAVWSVLLLLLLFLFYFIYSIFYIFYLYIYFILFFFNKLTFDLLMRVIIIIIIIKQIV